MKGVSRVSLAETALRCTAIQFLLSGVPRENVCQALLVSERALRKWIKAFNERGVDGLIVKKRPGRTAILHGEQAKEFVELIDQPEKADREFWTAKAFHGYLGEVYQLECSYQTIVRFFHKQGFALKVPQPWSDRQDEEKRKQFLKELEVLYKDSNIDIWFQDESGFEGDPRPRRRWDKKGKKTRVTKNGGHLRMNVMGMICPRTGEFFAIETSHSDTETFQAFLDEAGDTIRLERSKNILILDNASWHKKKTLGFHGWQPKFLPPYSPDFNPIERIWNTMKARWFNNHVCKNAQQLMDRLDQAILDVINNPERNQKTASIGTLF
ncbi:MAG: IS630 family transposase [Pseudomonadota bacterium]